MSILIVIPCFNEAERLLVDDYTDYLSRPEAHDLVFVNDGSTDKTIEVLESLKKRFPDKVNIIDQKENKGKAETIRNGVLKTLEGKQYDWIGYMDADLALHPEEFDYLLSKVEKGVKADLIMGSRIKLFGSTEIKRYWYRHYFGRLFATMVSRVLKLEVYDTQCGAKLIRWNLAGDLFREPFTSKWLFDVELISRLIGIVGRKNIDESLQEIPVRRWEEKGDSKVSVFYTLKVPLELRRIKRRYSEELSRV